MSAQWPALTLSAVPSERVALRLAATVRQLAVDGRSRCDIDRLCQIGGFRYRSVVLESSNGGHEALLVPRVTGGFEILVDPSSPKVGRRNAVKHDNLWRRRLRFRVAHEIGHSFFYERRSRPARRLLPASDAEEEFCDLFASALLISEDVIQQAPLAPRAIIGLADRFDVSIEVAGRAFVRSRGGISVCGLRRREPTTGLAPFEVLWSAGPAIAAHRAQRGNTVHLAPTDEEQFLKLASGDSYTAKLVELGANYFVATLEA